eukprot:Awhi_evm1s14604
MKLSNIHISSNAMTNGYFNNCKHIDVSSWLFKWTRSCLRNIVNILYCDNLQLEVGGSEVDNEYFRVS